MNPEERIGAIFGSMGSGDPKPRKPKSNWKRTLATIAIAGATTAALHATREHRKPRGSTASPCFAALTAHEIGGDMESAYDEAQRLFSEKPGGEDYIHCVLIEVCAANPAAPRPYFFKTLNTRRNNCARADRKYGTRHTPVADLVVDDTVIRDGLREVAVRACASDLKPKDLDALSINMGEMTTSEFARKYGISEAGVRKYIQRSATLLSECLTKSGVDH